MKMVIYTFSSPTWSRRVAAAGSFSGPPIPSAAGVGPRHIEVTVPPDPELIAIAVTPDCPEDGTRCVGVPAEDENIEELATERSAVFLTPPRGGNGANRRH